MNLFGVDSGVETLKMAPFHMLVLRMVEVVAKVEVDFVAVSKLVLESHDYGLFGSLLGEIINNYGSANAKFQGYKEYLIPCDANSNFLILED